MHLDFLLLQRLNIIVLGSNKSIQPGIFLGEHCNLILQIFHLNLDILILSNCRFETAILCLIIFDLIHVVSDDAIQSFDLFSHTAIISFHFSAFVLKYLKGLHVFLHFFDQELHLFSRFDLIVKSVL